MKVDPIIFLPWDTQHFGIRVARANERQIDQYSLRQIEACCRLQSIDCLYFLVDAADQDTVLELQRNKFDLVDIRMTFESGNPVTAPRLDCKDFNIRFSDERDEARLLEVSRDSYVDSRFYYDRCFDKGKASQLYQIWLAKSLAAGSSDSVIVAEVDQEPVGFVVCHMNRPQGEGNIGLVAVADKSQGLGLGKAMLAHAIDWLHRQGMTRVNVVTQGRNIAAQSLYQRCGFVSRSVELWYHKWFNGCT